MRAHALGTLVICILLTTACTPLVPAAFHPATPSEQAVARTMDAFLTAFHARDVTALNTLLTSDAIVERFVEGHRVSHQAARRGIPQQLGASRLLLGHPIKLVNFRHPGPDTASIETYIVTYPDSVTRTTHLRWYLRWEGGTWHLTKIEEMTWTLTDNAQGSGP